MRIAFMLLLLAHALIHLLGFFKAFSLMEIKELSLPISKPFGMLWLAAGLLLMGTAVALAFKFPNWWGVGLAALLASQFLIIHFWPDAKYGTAVNLILLIAIVLSYASETFENNFVDDVKEGLQRTADIPKEQITAQDIAHLPNPVQQYLRTVGALNKPKVYNFHTVFEAEMRGENQDWFPLSAEQYNFYDRFERLFYLDAKVKGLPTQGYHRYKDDSSGMLIKLLSIIPVVNVSGPQMFEAETVTLFNDMCFLAPATLIDRNIRWEPIDDRSARAFFTNHGVTISAVLQFNEQGQLVNFVSDDRLDVNKMKKFRFSTPLSQYRSINGHTLPTYGEAIWHYPEGPFVYGKYKLIEIEYNVTGRK